MSGATIIQLTLFALVFLAWVWLLVRTITLLQSRGGVGEEIGRWFRSPEDRRDRKHAAVPDLRAGRDAVHADRPAARLTPFAPRAARLDRADGASRLPPPGHAAVGDPRRPRDRAGRQARRPFCRFRARGSNLADCLLARVQAAFPEALLVHRLDMDTSGVMVFALTPSAQRHLGLQFERRHVKKTYHARVWGEMAGKRPARSTCRSLSTGPTGRCNT